MKWPWTKGISRKEALQNLEYQDKKLKYIYRKLRTKAESSIKMGKPLEGKVYAQAASKLAKSRALILHKMCELRSGIIEGEVSSVIIAAANAMKMSSNTVKEASEMELQRALEDIRLDIDVGSMTEELLDDALREAGYSPEEINEMVKSEIDSNLMREITPSQAVDNLRAKIERDLADAEI